MITAQAALVDVGACYVRHGDRIGAYIARRVPDRVAVDDLTQEVFLALLERPESMRPGSDPLPYLIGIARHAVAQWARRRARRREVPLAAIAPA